MKNICGKYMKNREQKIDTVVLNRYKSLFYPHSEE